MQEFTSAIPILICAIPAGLAIITYPLARLWRPLGPFLALLGTGAVAALSVPLLIGTMDERIYVALNRELRADSLSALLSALISLVGFVSVIYAIPYITHRRVYDNAGKDVTDRRVATFYALVLAFLSTMFWVVMTNNIIMLYVSVEASTIASGLLVAFYWDKRSLEAGYKYFMLLTVGIAFALFGSVLLYASASPHLPEGGGYRAILISDLAGVAGEIPRGMALLILSFFIVGFGTKAGIAPFHPWLPDAHAEAPSPVSALLSGVMIKTAVYALARVMSIFFPVGAYHPVAMFVIVLGAFTMLLDAVLIMAQDDLKRMLAYSSVSQMGYIAMGIGLVGIGFGKASGYLGGYGTAFHIVNHAMSKGVLFLAVGAVLYATAGRSMNELRGLGKRMPVTAICFFVAGLALAGVPPFSGFWSKLTLYLAGAQAHLWWAVGIAIGSSLLTLAAFARAGYKVFWSDGDGEPKSTEAKEAPLAMLIPMGLLTVLIIVFGLFPQLLYPLLDPAARALARIP